MNVRPLYDRVLVKRHDPVTQTRSGLFLPEAAQAKSSYAQVVAVGHGHLSSETGEVTPLKVEPGMTVLLAEWSGDEVKLDGVDHLIVREKDILAVSR